MPQLLIVEIYGIYNTSLQAAKNKMKNEISRANKRIKEN